MGKIPNISLTPLTVETTSECRADEYRNFLKKGTILDIQRRETARGRILRLVDVLKMTGLSRSTLYNRIAKKEFPHQISLGSRAVGWIEAEVEAWLNERKLLRPSETANAEIPDCAPVATYAVSSGVSQGQRGTDRPTQSISYTIAVNEGSPDLAQLHLMSAKLHFDRNSGAFWLKLIPESSAGRVWNSPRRKASLP